MIIRLLSLFAWQANQVAIKKNAEESNFLRTDYVCGQISEYNCPSNGSYCKLSCYNFSSVVGWCSRRGRCRRCRTSSQHCKCKQMEEDSCTNKTESCRGTLHHLIIIIILCYILMHWYGAVIIFGKSKFSISAEKIREMIFIFLPFIVRDIYW